MRQLPRAACLAVLLAAAPSDTGAHAWDQTPEERAAFEREYCAGWTDPLRREFLFRFFAIMNLDSQGRIVSERLVDSVGLLHAGRRVEALAALAASGTPGDDATPLQRRAAVAARAIKRGLETCDPEGRLDAPVRSGRRTILDHLPEAR